jgi:hypothetical protein
MQHALPTSSSLAWSFYLYLKKSTSYQFLIMQFSPTYHFIPLQSKYSPQHPVLKYPKSKFLL